MIWMQTATGRAFDLLQPQPSMVDFTVDVPDALARIPRFCGQINAGPYSVAQHCVIGADHIFEETARVDLAAAFLLHDGHEFIIGDIATPVAWALATFVAEDGERIKFTNLSLVEAQIRALKHRIDGAIFTAAGLPFPMPAAVHEKIKEIDARMFATERKHLLGRSPMPMHENYERAEPLPLRGALKVWPWPKAAEAWRDRFERYVVTAAAAFRKGVVIAADE